MDITTIQFISDDLMSVLRVDRYKRTYEDKKIDIIDQNRYILSNKKKEKKRLNSYRCRLNLLILATLFSELAIFITIR